MLAKSTAIFIFKDCCFMFVFGWFYLSVELTSDVRSLLRRLFFGNSKKGVEKNSRILFSRFCCKGTLLDFSVRPRGGKLRRGASTLPRSFREHGS